MVQNFLTNSLNTVNSHLLSLAWSGKSLWAAFQETHLHGYTSLVSWSLIYTWCYFFTPVRGQVEDKHREKGDEEARTNHGDCIEKRKTANV